MTDSVPEVPPPPTAAFTSLSRNGSFLRLWSGQTLSVLGTQLGQVAIPVLAVLLLGASTVEVGTLTASSTIAFLILGLPAGAWVDRWRKRRVMILADLLRAAAMLSIPLLWWWHVLEIWQLYLVAAVVGAATVFFDVAYQSFLPVLLPGRQIAGANARLEATAQISRIGGPALGGGLLAVISAPVLFLGEAVGYLASALLLTGAKDTEQPRSAADRRPLRTEIREGLEFVAHHKLLRRIVMCTAGLNLFSAMIFTLLPVVVLRHLNLGASGLGLILSAGSVGGLLGALWAPALARRIGEGTLIPFSALLAAVAVLLTPVAVAVAGPGWLSIGLLSLSQALMDFGALAYNILQVSMRQRICPPRLLGRMNASIRFVVYGVMPMAALLAGFLAGVVGELPTLWLAAIAGLAPVAAVWFSPLRRLKVLPDAVADAAPHGVQAG
ncbi:MAG: putative MFS-type transporter YfiS [Micrococcaceae bacterium]|nr:putative MFS-type transporter YfiS [Micrococcaceae bacterium]